MPRAKPQARAAGMTDARSYLDKAQEFLRAARQLRRLLPMKTRAEYDPAPMRAADARTAVQAAERMVALAVQTIASAPRDDK